ncbi:hypothetical protein [Novilysobacter arseniciresistens]|uniref:hypothetical protein n=1 Tax=Novilysobacter arseniciresistens TaxID=1385522 RepID=UPI0012698E94|nr:hypothetical protein [Lysobacter arseniciresistens]
MEITITTQPAAIQVVPFNGQLAVIVDPRQILANPNGPDMVAEVIRALGAGRGNEVLIYGGCIRDALEHSLAQIREGETFMFCQPECRNENEVVH